MIWFDIPAKKNITSKEKEIKSPERLWHKICFERDRTMKKALFVALFLLIGVELAFAQAYKWVDEKGVVHFTDDLDLVPEKYRLKIDRIGLPEEKPEVSTDTPGTPKKKEDPYKDQLGRGEDYWKGRVDEWRKKQDELDARGVIQDKALEWT